MASLREIKDRIGSVKSTLKITSAMKLVASSKLRKAQKAIETLRPYESALCDILASLAGSDPASGLTPPETVSLRSTPPQAVPPLTVPRVACVSGGVCPDTASASAGSSPLAPSHFVGPSPYPGAGMPVGDDSRVDCSSATGNAAEGSCPGVTSASLHPSQADAWAPPVCETTGGHGPAVDTPFGGSPARGSAAEGQWGPLAGSNLPPERGTEGVEKSAVSSAVALVVLSSNSSLCGGFNGNVVKKALELVKECGGDVDVFAVGRRGADALRKAGYPSDDWSELVGRPSYKSSSRLAGILSDAFFDGKYSRVLLVYNHFVTTAHQEVVVEQYLPLVSGSIAAAVAEDDDYYIIEPGKEDVLEELVPKVLTLKFHAAVLDSAAAEHAARTVAMQTATDNAQELLDELTLEYNKGRQQKITSEILDLLGGRTE